MNEHKEQDPGMPKLIISIDGVVIKEVQLDKERTTLGRRPYNDVVIDNLAVSGEHAAVQRTGGQVVLEDLDSTNGTFVNGKAIRRQALQHGDTIEVGKYKIQFLHEMADGRSGKTAATSPNVMMTTERTNGSELTGVIRVLSGASAGRELPLTKVVTTIGKPGVAVAAITRRQQAFVIVHVEGASRPLLNGSPIGDDPMPLRNGDLIELAGTQMQLIQT